LLKLDSVDYIFAADSMLIAGHWSNSHFRWGTSLYILILGELLNSGPWNLA